MPYWDERVEAMAQAYPDVRVDKYHIDILTAHFVLHPDRFDVVVASNLFGDILSDLGPACTGTIGIAPSGNINPERELPVAVRAGARLGAGHRRAGHRQPDRPDLVRRHDARASRRGGGGGGDRRAPIERTLVDPAARTRDLGGEAGTEACGRTVAAELLTLAGAGPAPHLLYSPPQPG